MAFIRRVRTKSGATAVQIAEYSQGKHHILKHLGSAHTDAELGLLLEQARSLIAPAQDTLDLDLQPQPRTERLRQAPTGQSQLYPQTPEQRAPRDGTGRVHTTSSLLLGRALEAAYQRLGFDAVGDPHFRELVLARIVEPTSKRDAGRVLAELGRTAPGYATIKRHLRAALEQDYRSTIARACFTHAGHSGDLSLVLYDVTTLYFEAEHEDELRKVGYSKERRVDPQIVVGLLVDRAGFPLEIGCFEGNKAETRTLVPIIEQFQARHRIADMAVVADAGMLSAANLRELDRAHLRFIVGSRQTKAPADLAGHFRWHGDALADGQRIDTITPATATPGAGTPPTGPNRSGTSMSTLSTGGPSGSTRANARCATQGRSPSRRTGPGPSSRARSRPSRPGSSRPRARAAAWTRPPWPGPAP